MLRAMSSASWITRLALIPGGGLQFVHGHDRPGTHLDDAAAHVEIVEHAFEQPRVAFQRGLVDLGGRPTAARRSAGRSTAAGNCPSGRTRSASPWAWAARARPGGRRSPARGVRSARRPRAGRGGARAAALPRPRPPTARWSVSIRGLRCGRLGQRAPLKSSFEAARPDHHPGQPGDQPGRARSPQDQFGSGQEPQRPFDHLGQAPADQPAPAARQRQHRPVGHERERRRDQRHAERPRASVIDTQPAPAPARHRATAAPRTPARAAAAARPPGPAIVSIRSAITAPASPSRFCAGPPAAVFSDGSPEWKLASARISRIGRRSPAPPRRTARRRAPRPPAPYPAKRHVAPGSPCDQPLINARRSRMIVPADSGVKDRLATTAGRVGDCG